MREPVRRAGLRVRRALLPLLWRRLVPPLVREAVERLDSSGFQAYLVGGCVRDLILGRRPPDWDITTDARPEDVMRLFPGSRERGAFGTVALSDVPSIEVTTFRTEGTYSDRRRPDWVAYVASLEEDLARRDFTCNALALAPGGRLIDPHGGYHALLRGVIRTVGDPPSRFEEDALRLLRAVRFAVVLDLHIDPKVAVAMVAGAHMLESISAERVRDEFSRIILTGRAAVGMALLRRTGLSAVVLPEIASLPGSTARATEVALSLAPARPVLRLAALLHPLEPDAAAALLRRLRYSNEEVKAVRALLAHLPSLDAVPPGQRSSLRRVLAGTGRSFAPDLLSVYRAVRRAQIEGDLSHEERWRIREGHRMLRRGDPLEIGDLAVGGREVMSVVGLGPGPALGKLLERLLDEVHDDPARNDPSLLLERARQLTDGTSPAGAEPTRREGNAVEETND